MLPKDWGDGYRNVWLGITAENQNGLIAGGRYCKRSLPQSHSSPMSLQLVRCDCLRMAPLPDWVISGGESGGGARVVNPQWIRDIISDCRRRGIAVFHKQWGSYRNNPLVVEQHMAVNRAAWRDKFEKEAGWSMASLCVNFRYAIRVVFLISA